MDTDWAICLKASLTLEVSNKKQHFTSILNYFLLNVYLEILILFQLEGPVEILKNVKIARVIHRSMDKEAVVFIYNGILLSHKKEHIQVSANEMINLEPILENEIGQKEKDNHHTLMYTYGI